MGVCVILFFVTTEAILTQDLSLPVQYQHLQKVQDTLMANVYILLANMVC